MSLFPQLYYDFNKFIQTVDKSLFSSAEIKLINLIRENFDEIAKSGKAQGKRGKLLNEIIQKHGKVAKEELKLESHISHDNSFPISKLSSLEIQNFRGFKETRKFELEKQYTLIYGPNGAGKSSFCEALEFSMLGFIKEAQTKRIDFKQYSTNISSNKLNYPVLKAINKNGEIIILNSSPAHYNFCFVEKNRIDGFSRISSNTAGDQNALLSTLFGLDEFNKFVEDFTDNINNYIDQEGIKYKELKQKEILLEGDKQSIENFKKKLAELTEAKHLFEIKANLNKTFEEIILFIEGNKTVKGRISIINEELENNANTVLEYIPTSEISSLLLTSTINFNEYTKIKKLYDSQKDKINFKKIYDLVCELEDISILICPVCETPISDTGDGYKTKVNPYTNAKSKLKELEVIASLQTNKKETWEKFVESTKEIINAIKTRNEIAIKVALDVQILIPTDLSKNATEDSQDFIDAFNNFNQIHTANELFSNELDLKIDMNNSDVQNSTAKKAVLQNERKQLETQLDEIKEIMTKEKTYKNEISRAINSIEAFNKNNEALLKEVETEKEQIKLNSEYVTAYITLINKLNSYKRQLPVDIVHNLNQLTKEFYNIINRHDQPFELLDRLELPSLPGEIIQVYFQDKPTEPHNAIKVLSEGHIRCLGLAILLAKTVHDNLGVIIFDDIVNAVDDDHRSGIINLIFNDERINKCQIILTCHGEEFIKNIENQFEINAHGKLVNRITFLPPTERNINITESCANYLVKATNYLNKGEKRDSLANARRALESLSDKLWKKISKTNLYKATITVEINQSGIPDLMSKIIGLNKLVKKIIPDDSKNSVSPFLNYLIGLETIHNIMWIYLNKGTHDEFERLEFDTVMVNELITNLSNLDTAITKFKV